MRRPGTPVSGSTGKRALLFLGLCAFLPAAGVAQERPVLLISSGLTVPTADYGDFHGTGPSFGAAIDVEVRPRIGLQGAVGYYFLPVRSQRGRESGLSAMGNLRLGLSPEASTVAPYILGGLGVWRTGFSDLWVSTGGVSPRPGREGQEDTRFAANLGGGLTVGLGRTLGLFGQARYVVVFSDEPKIRMIPLDFGVTFSRR